MRPRRSLTPTDPPLQVAFLPEQLGARLDAAAVSCLGDGVNASILWQEVALLERVRGKHKSPHRQTRMYARLCEVRVQPDPRLGLSTPLQRC